jgi:DNA repair protein RadC
MRIKDISKENRPRERFLKSGAASVSDAELLAIILQTGTKDENAIDISNRLISKYGLDTLSELSLNELQEIKGIGPAKAMQIMALLKDKKKEHFYALLLDSKNKIIKKDLVSVGTLDNSLVHPREVFKEAIKNSAAGVILVHNHPSGDPEPSENDVEITQKIAKAGNILNIKVLDHVIIAEKGWDNIKIEYS